MSWLTLMVALLLPSLSSAQEIPAGTVIPLMMDSTIRVSKSRVGEKIEGNVMQDVPLPSGEKINRRSEVYGHVVSVANQGPGGTIVLQFDQIKDAKQTIPFTAALLALASMSSVADARSPLNSTANLDPKSQWTTRQVGGDIVNRGRGKVASSSGVLGTWVQGAGVRIKLSPNPDAGCPSGPGYDREQSVWVFSSAACGIYGLNDVKIKNTGAATTPLGQIVLSFSKDTEIRGGSGWLLISLGK
jgi:hypothetical protein